MLKINSIKVLFFVFISAFLTACFEEPTIFYSSDVYVIDGDTIDIKGQRYRLIGFDTPETFRSKCAQELALGNKATDRVRQLINSSNTVSLIIEPHLDKYRRALAVLMIGNRDIAGILIGEGLARAYSGGKRFSWC